jgi:hypothetical protein
MNKFKVIIIIIILLSNISCKKNIIVEVKEDFYGCGCIIFKNNKKITQVIKISNEGIGSVNKSILNDNVKLIFMKKNKKINKRVKYLMFTENGDNKNNYLQFFA